MLLALPTSICWAASFQGYRSVVKHAHSGMIKQGSRYLWI